MSKVQKGNLSVGGKDVRMSMSFTKVDKESRLVSGFATMNNIDTQNDIVTPEASRKAFTRARGNIREMHQPIAAGRMVDFREDEYYDADSGKMYQGVFATAYISKGAQDTWEKVLDGTLSGFSIGGEILEATNEFNKDAGRQVRVINDYELTELSLVDNPANPLANVKSFTKVFSLDRNQEGESFVKGIAVESTIENVFVCREDKTVAMRDSESEECPVCGEAMTNAGWVEVAPDRTEKVRQIVSKFLGTAEEVTPTSLSEGGVEMGKGVKGDKPVEVETEEVEIDETEETETETEEVDEEVVDETEGTEEESEEVVDEVHDDESEISKKIDELKDVVTASIEESRGETLEKVAELEAKVNEATNQFLTKASELESKMDDFGNKIETQKVRLAELENNLEKMNSSSALRKSADLEEVPAETVVQKGTSWNGAFSGKSSGFSVDNLM